MLYNDNKKITIYIVDDDEEDRVLAQESLHKIEKDINIVHVGEGDELINKILENGISSPTIVLLDIKMGRKDGTEILTEIRAHKDLNAIPIVMYTSSNSENEILKCYQLGANSYVVKPIGMAEMDKTMKLFTNYWFGAVKLPHKKEK